MSKLSIIIPVFNERATLPAVLDRVAALAVSAEILVIDNVSTDGTREWLLEQTARPGLQVILQEVNRGKGHSVRRGIAAARGEWLVIQDADLEYRPEELLDLLAVAEAGHDAVFGSRLLRDPPPVPWHHALGRDFLNLVFRLLYRARVTDVATCYKLIRTTVAQGLRLTSLGFDLDYELACRLRRAGVEIVEVPITYLPRTIAEGKKLRWTDGFRALRAVLRYRCDGSSGGVGSGLGG
ncbi:MAG: glycosyltransferase family 2 protein [Fimbriimonadaceae bacterium]|nr:glycosyltransferase family 2 protein [Fimbriimonadaceae bacterium]